MQHVFVVNNYSEPPPLSEILYQPLISQVLDIKLYMCAP